MGADVWKSVELLRSGVEPFLAEWVTRDVRVPSDVGRSRETVTGFGSEEYRGRDTEHCLLK